MNREFSGLSGVLLLSKPVFLALDRNAGKLLNFFENPALRDAEHGFPVGCASPPHFPRTR